MPSVGTYPLYPPTDSKEYEKIIRDYCLSRFGGNVYLFGRNGQCQYGVDVVSTYMSNIIGVQCKDYSETTIKEKDIDDMIRLAENFEPPLTLFVIAIAQKTDANIQRYVLMKQSERLSQKKFPVEVVYWEEVENYIKDNPGIYAKYYGFLEGYRVFAKQEEILIVDINMLRIRFLELYCRFGIRDIILSDIFIGIPYELITKYDQFAVGLQKLICNSCVLQESDIYKNIKEFFRELDEYVGYLGTLVELNGSGICTVINPEIRKNREVYDGIIPMLRENLVKKYLIASELKEF